MVSVGDKAPDWIAPALVDGRGEYIDLVSRVRTNDAVVLLFAPADFVDPCTAEWVAVSAAGWHRHEDLAVVGLTGDSLFSHRAYVERTSVPFPLVSDFHGAVADQYDLLVEEWEGHREIPARATVVIDGNWNVLACEQAGPLDHASPAPVESAVPVLADCGIEVESPSVEYDAV